jgi:hypothetical protein
MPKEDDDIPFINKPVVLRGITRGKQTGDYPASPTVPLENIVQIKSQYAGLGNQRDIRSS